MADRTMTDNHSTDQNNNNNHNHNGKSNVPDNSDGGALETTENDFEAMTPTSKKKTNSRSFSSIRSLL